MLGGVISWRLNVWEEKRMAGYAVDLTTTTNALHEGFNLVTAANAAMDYRARAYRRVHEPQLVAASEISWGDTVVFEEMTLESAVVVGLYGGWAEDVSGTMRFRDGQTEHFRCSRFAHVWLVPEEMVILADPAPVAVYDMPFTIATYQGVTYQLPTTVTVTNNTA